MQMRARKFVIYAVAAALAVANGVAPRHAQGAMHPVATAAVQHHDHDAHVTADHDHDVPQKAAMPCHNEADDPAPGSPLHNCCVASCSAVAFIFASFNFGTATPHTDYDVPPARDLIQVALNSADPPPR